MARYSKRLAAQSTARLFADWINHKKDYTANMAHLPIKTYIGQVRLYYSKPNRPR